MSKGIGVLQQKLWHQVYKTDRPTTTTALAEALGCRPFHVRRGMQRLVASGLVRAAGTDRWARPKAPKEKKKARRVSRPGIDKLPGQGEMEF